jgi:putative transposase
VTAFEKRLAARAEQARDIALFRYGLIRPAADPGLSARQRGALVRELAAAEHRGPDGRPARVGRSTLDRWIRAWRAGGFDALAPGGRQALPRADAGVLELAVALKKEKPARSAAQVHRILTAQLPDGQAPCLRTIQRHFVRLELSRLCEPEPAREVFGRFEADAPGLLWVSDVLHGPAIGQDKTYLFAIEDDHSRYIVGWWWTTREDVLGMFAALRRAVEEFGAPQALYVDNGAPYVSKQLLHALAVLGVRITHSKPRRPQGRGKIERLFETVRAQFLVEVATAGAATQAGTPVGSVSELEELFGSWRAQAYHQTPHSETGQAPAARLANGRSRHRPAAPKLIEEAFLWQDFRTVTKAGTISLHGNRYEVDPSLAGRKVELLYNPLDLTVGVRVRHRGVEMGQAAPQVIGRHSHPQASPAAPAPAPATGIDYLRILAEAHRAEQGAAIEFQALADDPGRQAGAPDADGGQAR